MPKVVANGRTIVSRLYDIIILADTPRTVMGLFLNTLMAATNISVDGEDLILNHLRCCIS